MTMYDRDDADDYLVIDRWEGGVGWVAHPGEEGQRASHAIVGDDGVWLFDPLDAPGIEDLLADLGDVAGVAVLSNWHARDAGEFAQRYDVPVFVPEWLDRVEELTDAPIRRYSGTLGDSGFRVRRVEPLPGWKEAVAYRESDRTLYVADILGTAPLFTVGKERLGVFLLGRPFPPREQFVEFAPERVLVGHGEGVFEYAPAALADALAGARRRFPKALLTSGGAQLRALFDAVRE